MDCGQILLRICELSLSEELWNADVLEQASWICSDQMLRACIWCLQLAFTMVWMLIISQLGYYKLLYGPQVLLQMNIAYFLPSIPLLGLSSQFDERLDQKFGMPAIRI